MKKYRAILIAALAGLALLAPLRASAQADADKWNFSIMPYLWLPTLDAKLRYGPPPSGGSSAKVSVDPDTLLSNLDFALMLTGKAQKGRWVLATDFIYLDLSGSKSKVESVDFAGPGGTATVATANLNANVNTSLTGVVWTMLGGYEVLPGKDANLALLGGIRYLGLKASTDYQLTADVTGPPGTATFARTGSASKKDDVLSAIVGAGGRARLGQSNWFANYYADVGGGSSVFTWQGIVGLGYAFKWGDVILDYRYLYYDQSGDKLLQEVKLGGLALGANFRF